MDALLGFFGPWACEIDVMLGGKSEADDSSLAPSTEPADAPPAESDTCVVQ